MKTLRVTNKIDELKTDYEQAARQADTFYTAELLKRNGAVIDENGERKAISSVVASWMSHSNPLLNVKPVNMSKRYIINEHTGNPTTQTVNSTRLEELIAMELYKKTDYEGSDIDCVVDYQAPIERASGGKTKGIGKIDLIAVSHSNRKIYLMELKRHGNVQESLLRCVAESYTYFMQIDKEKLRNEVARSKKINEFPLRNDVKNYEVLPSVLVFENQRQHSQYKSPYFYKVKELMKSLGVSMFVIQVDQGYTDRAYKQYIPNCQILDVTE